MRPRKFFFLSHSFLNSTIFVHLFSTFSSDSSLFDTQFLHLSISPTVITFNVATNFSSKLIRVAMVLTASLNVIPVSHFFGSDYVSSRNSCQYNFSFQPPSSEFVLAFSSSSVPTADVQHVLALLQCYPAIPASKNS